MEVDSGPLLCSVQVKIVHICEATLTKRLIEFEGTESGGLTVCAFCALSMIR